MTPFEHLSVLISIVIGLGMAHLMIAGHELVEARARVRAYWLSSVWLVLVFVGLLEWWWTFFALRDAINETKWNFFFFLFVLASPMAMYLAAAFVLPRAPREREGTIDLRRHYYGNRAWFFGVLAISPAFDGMRRAFQAGTVLDVGAWSNGVAALLLATLAVVERPWYHALITLAVGALFLSFIVSSALMLR
jgi:hypothetical protein